ncbi:MULTISPECIES: hypothetical protein [unclassified Brachybacterium]|uniref:hypothetical protein n=1 Tax=unclassified Brachybacterium TaxID=2623841 RepID=UPI003F996C67
MLLGVIGFEAALIGLLLWAYFSGLVPYAVVWGDVGTWAQAVATVVGLFFAGLSLLVAAWQVRQHRDSERLRGEEKKDVVRRSISLRSEWRERISNGRRERVLVYTYELSNHSSLPVTNVKIVVHQLDDDNESRYDLDSLTTLDDYFQGVAVGTLAPHESVSGTIEVTNWNAIGMLEPDRVANPEFCFTDPWGLHWRRPGTTWGKGQAVDEPMGGPLCMCCGNLPQTRRQSWASAQA